MARRAGSRRAARAADNVAPPVVDPPLLTARPGAPGALRRGSSRVLAPGSEGPKSPTPPASHAPPSPRGERAEGSEAKPGELQGEASARPPRAVPLSKAGGA